MTATGSGTTRRGEALRWPFQTSLSLAGVRCVVRYVVLPFALPLTGVANGIATGAALVVSLALDAAASIVTTLRWLWQTRHPRRWHYVPVAAVLAVLVGAFLVNDAVRLATRA